MKNRIDVEYLREQAEKTLAELDQIALLPDELPGEFVFSPGSHRLEVSDMAELHEARKILRKMYGWQDSLDNKFFSCGRVIVTFKPEDTSRLPLPFDLWVAAPPEQFPAALLGDCQLVPCEPNQEYYISCPI